MKIKALETILKNSSLAIQVQSLPLTAITKLIEHIGLEDAGPIIALTTTEQFKAIVDADMWAIMKSGTEESLSSERFLTWVEILSELGDKGAAEKLMELDDELLTAALADVLQVFDTEELSSLNSLNGFSQGSNIEAHLKRSEYIDIDRYIIVFKNTQALSALSEILTSWSGIDHTHFCSIIDRCVQVTLDQLAETDGLMPNYINTAKDDALDARNNRRTEMGFVSRSDATSFLNLARDRLPLETTSSSNNPIFRSYLRQYKRDQQDSDMTFSLLSEPLIKLVEELHEPNVASSANTLVPIKQSQSQGPDSEFLNVLLKLQIQNPTFYESQLTEIAFLGNILLTGCSIEERALRASESVQITYTTCRLGVEFILSQRDQEWSSSGAIGLIQSLGCITLFETGWHLIFKKVSQSTLEKLVEKLAHWASENGKNRTQISSLQLEFKRALQQNKPWEVRQKITWLTGRLGQRLVAVLQGFLDECPHHLIQKSQGLGTSEDIIFFSSLDDIAKAKSFLL